MRVAGATIEAIAAHFNDGSVVDSLVFVGEQAIKIGNTVYELP